MFLRVHTKYRYYHLNLSLKVWHAYFWVHRGGGILVQTHCILKPERDFNQWRTTSGEEKAQRCSRQLGWRSQGRELGMGRLVWAGREKMPEVFSLPASLHVPCLSGHGEIIDCETVDGTERIQCHDVLCLKDSKAHSLTPGTTDLGKCCSFIQTPTFSVEIKVKTTMFRDCTGKWRLTE